MELQLITDFSPYKYNTHDDWKLINGVLQHNAIGAYVEYQGNYSRIDGLLTSSFAVRDKQDCCLAYLVYVYQDYKPIKNLRLCSAKEYNEHGHQRLIEQLKGLIKQHEGQISLLKEAYNRLKTGSNTTDICKYGPCNKSLYGICDGECDYSG